MSALRELIWVGLGGFAGASLRYLVSGWVQHQTGSHSFPAGTVVVNLLGCLLIGIMSGLVEMREARLFLIIGLLGGFTTFSTFGNEAVQLLKNGTPLAFIIYAGLHFGVGLLAVVMGFSIAKWI